MFSTLLLEKLNVKIVGAGTVTGVLGENEKAKLKKLHEENQKFVTIPRRLVQKKVELMLLIISFVQIALFLEVHLKKKFKLLDIIVQNHLKQTKHNHAQGIVVKLCF